MNEEAKLFLRNIGVLVLESADASADNEITDGGPERRDSGADQAVVKPETPGVLAAQDGQLGERDRVINEGRDGVPLLAAVEVVVAADVVGVNGDELGEGWTDGHELNPVDFNV